MGKSDGTRNADPYLLARISEILIQPLKRLLYISQQTARFTEEKYTSGGHTHFSSCALQQRESQAALDPLYLASYRTLRQSGRFRSFCEALMPRDEMKKVKFVEIEWSCP